MSRRNLVPQSDWIETSAHITSATYHYARLSEIDLEASLDHSFYLMTFSYDVAGERYTGQFEQFEPIAEGSDPTVFSNPAVPGENDLSLYPASSKHLIIIWIAGAGIAILTIYIASHFGWPE